MPNFVDYEVEYTNVKPWNGSNLGSGKMTISLPIGSTGIRGKLKRTIERKINSLGVRIDSFRELK